jgi:hypothetical protein
MGTYRGVFLGAANRIIMALFGEIEETEWMTVHHPCHTEYGEK